MCQTPIDDLNYKIYEIPTAKVGHGKQISKLINEGTSPMLETRSRPSRHTRYRRAGMFSTLPQGEY
jgi:hypothetical protein